MSNLGFERRLSEIGLSLVRTPVGDHHVLEQCARGYNIGGEPNRHIILSDYATTGDAPCCRCGSRLTPETANTIERQRSKSFSQGVCINSLGVAAIIL
jgi:hypothetical protein